MTDKAAKAQALLWECEKLRTDLNRKLREMAELHASIASERLNRGEADGFVDLHAAIAALGEAQDFVAAERLIAEGEKHASKHSGKARANLDSELERATVWIQTLKMAAGDGVTTKTRVRRP